MNLSDKKKIQLPGTVSCFQHTKLIGSFSNIYFFSLNPLIAYPYNYLFSAKLPSYFQQKRGRSSSLPAGCWLSTPWNSAQHHPLPYLESARGRGKLQVPTAPPQVGNELKRLRNKPMLSQGNADIPALVRNSKGDAL